MSAERRQTPRYQAELRVRIQSQSRGAVEGNSADLSLGGIFVVLDPPLPVDELIKISFGEQVNHIEVEGLVVHSLSGYGNGVMFMNRTDESDRRIQRLIQGLMAAQT